jgi:hypothetical protein
MRNLSSRPIRLRAMPLTPALASVTLLAACGAATTTSSQSASFLTRARAVCAVYYNDAYALPPPIGLAQLREYPAEQQRLRTQRLSGLRVLKAPPSTQAAYTRYVSEMGRADTLYAAAIARLGEAESSGSAAKRAGAKGAVERLRRRANRLEAKLETQARALGLGRCAEEPYSATHTVSLSG